MRERKKSSVAGQANSTAELPENCPYWKSNWEFRLSAITPKALCLCGFRGFFRGDYIAEFDSVANANHVLDQLMEVVQSLARFPERGSYPRELVALGIKAYRQTAFKPYRVIYRVGGNQVVIYLIVDGRRDMQSVLSRRLLGT